VHRRKKREKNMEVKAEKKPDKRTAYAERHKLTRTWINNDLKVFLEEGVLWRYYEGII